MSWWVGLNRRQLSALARVQPPPSRSPLVQVQRYRMDGTPVTECGQRPALIGTWNQHGVAVRERKRRERRAVSA